MKALSRVWTLFLLVIIACWLPQLKISIISLNIFHQPALAQSLPIPISLPSDAEIQLKGSDGTRSGRVVSLDSQKITLQRSGNTTSIPLNTINRVIYDRRSPFYRASGDHVLRGRRASPTGSQDTWGPIPLGDFRYEDASQGQAAVILDSVLSSVEVRGINTVARRATYVADEMRFDVQQGAVTIVVTPY